MSGSLVRLRRSSASSIRHVIRSRRGCRTISNLGTRVWAPSWSPGVACSTRIASPSTLRLLTSSSTLLKDYPPHTLFPMPALSPTMENGTIASWSKQEGDEFAAGDVLCTIETDKASVDFESQDDGVLAKILRQGPDAVDLPIGTPICVVVEEAADVIAFADYQAPEAPAGVAASAEPEPAAVPAAAPTAESVPNRTVEPEHVLMPSARHVAESQGLDATGLQGTGKGGRVSKGDVLAALEVGTLPTLSQRSGADTSAAAAGAPAAAAAPMPAASATAAVNLAVPEVQTAGGFEDTPNNKMRKIIASRLTESKRDVPHFYTAVEVELDNVLALRKQLAKNHDVKVSVNDFIIRCCALALRDVPEVNGTYDAASDSVRLQKSVDVSVAVATPTGLITPIVFNTDKIGLSEITETVRDLAGRAREGKLAPEEYQGGTFSVSNLGMFGIDEFSAVINPPQAAILAVGGGSARVVPTPFIDGAEEQPKPSIKTIMTARLSADRRVVDEATAGLFLSAFKHYITEPELLML